MNLVVKEKRRIVFSTRMTQMEQIFADDPLKKSASILIIRVICVLKENGRIFLGNLKRKVR